MANMTTNYFNEPMEQAKARKARRAVEGAVIVARDIMAGDEDFNTGDFLSSLRALRAWLFGTDPAEEGLRTAMWALVGVNAALGVGGNRPEKFTTSRPMIAELLDMRIDLIARTEAALHGGPAQADPFAGLGGEPV